MSNIVGSEEFSNFQGIPAGVNLSKNFLGQVIEICTVTRDYKRTMEEMVTKNKKW